MCSSRTIVTDGHAGNGRRCARTSRGRDRGQEFPWLPARASGLGLARGAIRGVVPEDARRIGGAVRSLRALLGTGGRAARGGRLLPAGFAGGLGAVVSGSADALLWLGGRRSRRNPCSPSGSRHPESSSAPKKLVQLRTKRLDEAGRLLEPSCFAGRARDEFLGSENQLPLRRAFRELSFASQASGGSLVLLSQRRGRGHPDSQPTPSPSRSKPCGSLPTDCEWARNVGAAEVRRWRENAEVRVRGISCGLRRQFSVCRLGFRGGLGLRRHVCRLGFRGGLGRRSCCRSLVWVEQCSWTCSPEPAAGIHRLL